MSKGDKDRTDDTERYRLSHEHTFGDGPPPPAVGSDSIEVYIGGEKVDSSILHMEEPIVFPDAHPLVKIKYECGQQAFDGVEMRCGMMVAPAPREKGKGMIVYLSGTPSEILHMVLAAIDSAEAFGLRDALKLCIERGVGMGDVKEVLGEEWYL